MMGRRPPLLAAGLAFLLLAGCGTPDLETGRRAYDSGNYEVARRHFAALADFGMPEAQARLGKQYMWGKGVERDGEQALALLEKAEAGERGRQYAQDIQRARILLAAKSLNRGDGPFTAAESLSILRAAAAQDNPYACFELGRAYERGLGVAPDGRRAVEYYNRSGDGGYGRGYYYSAKIYEKGDLLPRDAEMARQLYNAAARNGYVKARIKLSTLRDEAAEEEAATVPGGGVWMAKN